MNVPQNPATTTGPIPGTAFAIATAGAFRNRMLNTDTGRNVAAALEQSVLDDESSAVENAAKPASVLGLLGEQVVSDLADRKLEFPDDRHETQQCGSVGDFQGAAVVESATDSALEVLRAAGLLRDGEDSVARLDAVHDASPAVDVVGAHSVGEGSAAEDHDRSSAADVNTEHRQERIAFAVQAVREASAEFDAIAMREKDETSDVESAVEAPAVERPVVIESDEWWDGYLEACEELSSRGMAAFRVRSILAGMFCGAVTFGVLAALDVF